MGKRDVVRLERNYLNEHEDVLLNLPANKLEVERLRSSLFVMLERIAKLERRVRIVQKAFVTKPRV
jgi:hypothetical protein